MGNLSSRGMRRSLDGFDKLINNGAHEPRENRHDMVRYLFARELKGSSKAISMSRLPVECIGNIDMMHKGLIIVLKELQTGIREQNIMKCKYPVLALLNLITMPNNMNAESGEVRDVFLSLGGAFVLVDVLVAFNDIPLSTETLPQWRALVLVRNECLRILRNLCQARGSISLEIASKPLCLRVFSLLGEPLNFENAVQFCEEILVTTHNVVRLRDMPNMQKIVQGLNYRQMAIFCRLLALMVYEPEASDALGPSYIKTLRKKKEKQDLFQDNREFLVDIPGFLGSIVGLLSVCVKIPDGHWIDQVLTRFPSLADVLVSLLGVDVFKDDNKTMPDNPLVSFIHSHVPSNHSSTDFMDSLVEYFNSMFMNRGGQSSISDDQFINLMGNGVPITFVGINDSAQPNGVRVGAALGPAAGFNRTDGVETYAYEDVSHSAHQVEVVFVLCMLLHSSRRAIVQQTCAENGLIPVLYQMWGKMRWERTFKKNLRTCSKKARVDHIPGDHVEECDSEEEDSNGPHGPGCQCNNPANALRVQMLRVVHSFCEPDSVADSPYLRLLMSVDGVKQQNPDYDATGIEHLHSPGPYSLYDLIIDSLMKQKKESAYVFWMTSALETSVRAGGPMFQNYLLHRSMLEFLLTSILDERFTVVGTLQGSFDLLAEIIKFNVKAFRRMDEYLTDMSFDRLVTLMMDCVVDSNVFLRSVIVSLGRFKEETGREQTDFRFGRYLLQHGGRMMIDVLSSVSVNELNTDNICCLNTSLTFLVLAGKINKIDSLLQMVSDYDMARGTPEVLLTNLKELLVVWGDYYEYRSDRDKMTLAIGSGIPFDEWKSTQECILQKLS